MTRMTLSARVGADGVLQVPLGASEANKEVRVTIEPTEASSMTAEEWRAWVLATAGSVTDPTFRRHEQGEYEERDQLP